MHGAIPPLPQYAFMAWCLVKHWDNFTRMCFGDSAPDYCDFCSVHVYTVESILDCPYSIECPNDYCSRFITW
jgi:hypothetical protein